MSFSSSSSEEREAAQIAFTDAIGYMNARNKASRYIQMLVDVKYFEYYDRAICEGNNVSAAKEIATSRANVEKLHKQQTLAAQTIYMYRNHDDNLPENSQLNINRMLRS